MDKVINLDIHDVYQMLISECRYGYTRNNHLMPGDAYSKVKRIVPQMYKVDKKQAIYTLRQICDECISLQLITNFYNGEDDEFENRKEAIEFVYWCLNWIKKHESKTEPSWIPCHYDQFKQNLELDKEPRYLIYDITQDKRIQVTKDPVSQEDYMDVLMDYVLKHKKLNQTVTYQKERLEEKALRGGTKINFKYHILTPVKIDFYVEHI